MPNDTPDPAAFFRELIGQFAGSGDANKSDDLARLFAGTAGAQTAFKAVMDRALAAANVPGRHELDDLAARLSRLEAALFRIEARLAEIGTGMGQR